MKSDGFSRTKIAMIPLLLALLILLAGIFIAQALRTLERQPWYDQALAAATKAQYAQDALRRYIVSNNLPILPEDLNRTGLIGPEWTDLTTSLGQLEAKRTSLNPDFAALILSFYSQAGLKENDVVAIGASGSFPALSIAAISAANEMKLRSNVIASIGASMYGATRPEMPISRMLMFLKEQGILDFELLAVSPGGDSDSGGGGMDEGARDIILRVAAQSGVPLVSEASLTDSIKRRLDLYGLSVRCFVNIGGASVNLGETPESLMLPPGLLPDGLTIPKNPERGLVFEYASKDIPVIHMLNIRGLALEHGLPIDPIPLPELGTADFYYRTIYPLSVIIVSLTLALLCLLLGRLDWQHKQLDTLDENESSQSRS